MKLVLLLLTGFWLGIVFGISFVEAPLKFQAPGITTELGLGIGQLVFGALNKIELILMIGVLLTSMKLFKEMDNGLIASIFILFLIVFVQTVILLPMLNQRVELILGGQEVAPSNHHLLFIFFEIVKLITLFLTFLKSYKL